MQRARAGTLLVIAGLIVAAFLAAASALAAPRTGSYSGATSQAGQVMDFTVVKVGSGKTATKDATNLEINSALVTCSGPQGTQTVTAPLVKGGDYKISQQGKFKFHGGININENNALIAHGTGTITGHFKSSHKVDGSFQFTWNFNNNAPAGLQGAHCDTGPQTYTATRQ